MSDAALIPVERIERSIYLIRGCKVMLDRDLASLYGVETRALNQSVTRNLRRFPGDFMFELTREEIMRISQTVISSGDLKFSKNVRCFTEQGVAMLSTVLRSTRAIDVNIAIIRTFVKLRQLLESHVKLARKLADMEAKYDEQFQVVFEALNGLMAPPPAKRTPIGFSVKESGPRYSTRKSQRTR
jgi:ORF6N domain